MSLQSIAAEGLRKAEERVQRVAERLARGSLADASAPEDMVDLSAEMVALMEASHAHAAVAKVIETANQLEENTLDILA
jgi:flagellar basal body rod protein FlgC